MRTVSNKRSPIAGWADPGGTVAVQTDEVERRVERLSQSLRDAGLRLTHQRLEIVRVIAADETHPDVETVYRVVRERVPTISLDTVYRTLATLTERGLITRVLFTPGPARYDANPRPAPPLRVHTLRAGPRRRGRRAGRHPADPRSHSHRATRRGDRPVPRRVRRLPEQGDDHSMSDVDSRMTAGFGRLVDDAPELTHRRPARSGADRQPRRCHERRDGHVR